MFDIYEKLKDYSSIAISAHIRPDGDAIGSCLGLYFYLKKRLPNVDIKVYLEEIDACFNVMPNIDVIVNDIDDSMNAEAFVVIDSTTDRIGEAVKIFEKALFTINIDHHISNEGGLCDLEYIVPSASSASELVYDLLDVNYLDDVIASYIYMGIAHDTGIFRFSNVSPKTMMTISKLLEFKFDFSHIIDVTFYEKTYLQNILQAKVVLGSKLYHDGKFIVGVADDELIKSNNALKSDFDGCVNQLLLTKNVEVAAFIYAKSENDYKVSMRACSDLVDVSTICQKFGGGGHVRASGTDYSGNINELIDELIKLTGEQING